MNEYRKLVAELTAATPARPARPGILPEHTAALNFWRVATCGAGAAELLEAAELSERTEG